MSNVHLFLDLETTCWAAEDAPHPAREIIELGAVLWDHDLQTELGTFSRLVRPANHPTLSNYCCELTGIQQNEIDQADVYPCVLAAMIEWIHTKAPTDTVPLLTTWGWFDKQQLKRECRAHHVRFPFGRPLFNLRPLAMRSIAQRDDHGIERRFGLSEALEHVGLCHPGPLHRALPDAQATLSMFCWCNEPPPRYEGQNLPENGSLLSSVHVFDPHA